MSAILAFMFAFLINQYDAAKILGVFPTPSISHQVVFRPLTQELAKRGHEVVIITADPAFEKGKTPPNFKEIDVHNLSYTKWQEMYKITSRGDSDLESSITPFFNVFNEIVELQLKLPEIQSLIKKEKFDLLLLEACIRSALVYSHVFDAPVIQVGSLGFFDYNIHTIGASWHPLLYPTFMNQKIYNLTKWEKIYALWKYYNLENIINSFEDKENVMVKRIFGPNTPTINELKNNVDMMLLNVHPLWESNRPVPPNVVYIWGIHEKPEKELPHDIKNYLDSSKNGVIYMSLGTNVQPSLLPPEKVQIFVKTFSQLPYDFLWKWDKDELPGRTENIRIAKWLPQSDLLRHPNIKVFITQGGIQSTGEAITARVPLIGIPMLGDQWFNVEKIVYHKIGVKLGMKALQENELRNAIETVINEPSYRENVIRLSEMMHDEPMSPLDRAVWWTEHVLRHRGASHLRSPAANISWAEYLELEIVLTIILAFTIIFCGIITIIYSIVQYLRKTIKLRKKVKQC